MKPVLIQTLFRKMKNRIRLPDPPATSDAIETPRRDRTTSILIAIVIIAIILVAVL